MPLKCRSCGHVNPDNADNCDRCGCDLQYSRLFETVVKNRERESRFLFPPVISDEGDSLLPEIDEETAVQSGTDKEERAHPGNPRPVSAQQQASSPSSPVSRELQEKASQILVSVTGELLLFMVLFMVISILARIIAPQLILPNWKLAVVSLSDYGFITGSAMIFTGKSAASILTAPIIR